MPFHLYPHQLEQRRGIYSAIRSGARRVLACAATGTGKTELAGAIVADLLTRGGRSLFVVDRIQLAEQTYERFARRFGFPASILQGKHPLFREDAPVQIATHQTLTRRRPWLESWIRHDKTVLIWWDEAHESAWCSFADWFRELTAGMPNVIHIYLTATPDMSDPTRGFADITDAIVPGLTPGAAMDAGYLVRDRYIEVPLCADLGSVRIRGNDYDDTDLGTTMSSTSSIDALISAWLDNCPDRQTIAYGANVSHATALYEGFAARGISTALLTGTTSDADRTRIMSGMRDRSIRVLCNCMIAVKGTDVPSVSCIAYSRPTKSISMWIQSVGRGLRIYIDGNGEPLTDAFLDRVAPKEDCIILDQGNCLKTHGPAREYGPYRMMHGKPKDVADEDFDAATGIVKGWACHRCGEKPNPSSQHACRACGERRHMTSADHVCHEPEGAYIAPVGAVLRAYPMTIYAIIDHDRTNSWLMAGYRHPSGRRFSVSCLVAEADRPALTRGARVRVSGTVTEHEPTSYDSAGVPRDGRVRIAKTLITLEKPR